MKTGGICFTALVVLCLLLASCASSENPPMVAIFTHHNQELQKTGSNQFQYQSIAYSLDKGRSWTKYPGNPVLKNPGIRDFRDPKVSWYEPGNKWIMVFTA